MIKNFTVVVPTFKGQDVICDCFDAILNQETGDYLYDVIVVIDGPNDDLRDKVLAYSDKFKAIGVSLNVVQHEKNLGHFEARLRGALEAESDYILFIDDRAVVDINYFNSILAEKSDAIIPRVIQGEGLNIVSKTINLIRGKLYDKHVSDTQSKELTLNNFDFTPKGTTSFWIRKEDWIIVCKEVKSKHGNTRDISDDTRLLKLILFRTGITRSANAKITYQSRGKLKEELVHLYKRGPKFVDYYYKSTSPYFLILICAQLVLVGILAISILSPRLMAVIIISALVINILISFYLAKKLTQIVPTYIGLLLISVVFASGVCKGIVLKYLGYVKKYLPLKSVFSHKLNLIWIKNKQI